MHRADQIGSWFVGVVKGDSMKEIYAFSSGRQQREDKVSILYVGVIIIVCMIARLYDCCGHILNCSYAYFA